MLPMPRFTPMMAANWTGWTPSSRTMGNISGAASRTPETSSIIMPITTRTTLITSRITTGSAEKE